MASTPLGNSAREAAYVAVVGPGDDATKEETSIAKAVGNLLAKRGAVVVCGGLGGVMAAACQGASEAGGLTVGLLPGRDRVAGNMYLSVALPTGMGELRNGLVVGVCDAVIAIGGSWGTLSEIALARRTAKRTVVISGWDVTDPLNGRAADFDRASSAEEAVDTVLLPPTDAVLSRSRWRRWRLRSCAAGEPPAGSTAGSSDLPELADIWHAFELAQQHYEMDLQLFSVRMNLFLLIQRARCPFRRPVWQHRPGYGHSHWAGAGRGLGIAGV
jgi:hypothetical protein